MGNDASDNKADSAQTERPSSADDGKPEKRKSLADFLIESNIKPLVFMGQCVNFFGLKAVVGLLLGAAIVYGVALFRPLPYAKAASLLDNPPTPKATPSPADAKMVKLHGFVTDSQDRPVEGFVVAVLASQHGPFFPRNGEFSIPVLQSDKYNIALWSEGYQKIQVYSELSVEPDNVGFTVGPLRLLSNPSLSPVSLGASALLKSKSTDPVLAESWRLNDRLQFQTLSSE